ncbi:sugar porter family MFS transporter [Streptomyces luteolus]|uniref:Sugar porter family MFS transporter n=1 Tax=Streptomyces luteolus TaxID=3043615 RepID=A0ABT6SSU5_9ACTN|nr:sugar porter family MFS transporter [Streptomyces sp. B-S-A12]MDI3418646.1 sugar porter family MFS transporter [Streptomyces sp. B-S-A12]
MDTVERHASRESHSSAVITSTPTGPPPANSARFMLFVVAIAALGGLLFGYDTGIISSALLDVSAEFGLGTFGKQLVTSAILVGGIVGALGSGPISDRFGRRRTVLAVAILFVVGAIGTAVAPDAASLVITRFVLGLAVGAVTQILPVYIAEVAPAERRGSLVVLFQLMIAGGQLVSYLVGYGIQGHWRWMFALAVIPGVVLFAGMLRLPESPRWLVSQGRQDEARGVLARIRGDHATAAREVTEIESVHQEAGGSWADLRQRWVRPALTAAVGISVLCQLTGINAVIYYAPTILTDSGFGKSASILATIGVGVVLVAMTVVGTFMVDRVGRRRLLLLFIPASVVALVVLGAAFIGGDPTGGERWVVVAAMLAYIAFNGGSLSVVIWLLNSEVIPLAVRGKGTGLASVSMWTSDLLVSLTALSLIGAIGASGTFWLYGAVSVFAFFFVLRCVPETKGRTLEEIENSLHDGTFQPRAARRTVGQ